MIQAPPQRVWEVVADPHHLPRWWPNTVRVEDVREADGEVEGWTKMLGTESGTRVRGDYRRTRASETNVFAWEQELTDSPFERILRSATVEIRLDGEQNDTATRVTVRSEERLRGLSRLGSPLMRTAAGKRLDEALENLDHALVGP